MTLLPALARAVLFLFGTYPGQPYDRFRAAYNNGRRTK